MEQIVDIYGFAKNHLTNSLANDMRRLAYRPDAKETVAIICSENLKTKAKKLHVGNTIQDTQCPNLKSEIIVCKELGCFSDELLKSYEKFYILVDSSLMAIVMSKRNFHSEVDDFFERVQESGKKVLVCRDLGPNENEYANEFYWRLPQKCRRWNNEVKLNLMGSCNSTIEDGGNDVQPEEEKKVEEETTAITSEDPGGRRCVQVGSHHTMKVTSTSSKPLQIEQYGDNNAVSIKIVPGVKNTIKIVVNTEKRSKEDEDSLITDLKEDQGLVLLMKSSGCSSLSITKGSIIIEMDVEPGINIDKEWLSSLLTLLFEERLRKLFPEGISLDVDVENTWTVTLQEIETARKSDLHALCVPKEKYDALLKENIELTRKIKEAMSKHHQGSLQREEGSKTTSMAEANSGMKGGECIHGIVIGKEETVTNTYKAPGKVSPTEIEGCTNVTKIGDIQGKSVSISTGSKNVTMKTNGMLQVTEKPHREREGGVLRKGKVIGTQQKEDNIFEQSPQGHGHYNFKGRETVGLQAKSVNINNTTKSEQPTKRQKPEDKSNMPLNIKVNAGTGGKFKNLTVAGVVTGGVGNEHTGPAPPAQSLKTNLDDADLEVNGPSGSLQADNAQVLGLVEGGINNKYNTGNKETKSKKKDEVCYKMDAEPRGLCYIFNNKKFENRDSRIGTEIDKDELVRVFRKLKFKVETIDDSGAADMEAKLRELSEISHKDFDCVVVIFLTHGKEGAIQGSDNDWLRVSTITSYFKSGVCPTLAEKPKLFFFQSCRGTKIQKGVKADGDDDDVGAAAGDEGEKLVAPEADFFFGYSTVSGAKSLRNVETGSWYIQELTKTLDEYADSEDLLSMMTTVKRRVNDRKSECQDGSFIKQTAEMTSRLLKKLYF